MSFIESASRGVDRVSELSSKFMAYADSNRQKLGKVVINTVLLIIIFALFGCFDFITMRFNFGILWGQPTLTDSQYLKYIIEGGKSVNEAQLIVTAQFWTKVLTKAIAGGVCAFNIGINLSFDIEKDKDGILKENSQKYEKLVKFKDQKTFEDYVINVFNPKQKKKAYISQINRKIYLLNKFATNKSKLLYNADSDIPEKKEELERLKAKNRYCIKRAELERLKTDEYIDKNLDSLKVNYSYVDPIVFDLEIDGKGTYKGVKVKGNVGAGKVRATSSVLLGMVAVSMLLASLIPDFDKNELKENCESFAKWLSTYGINFITDIGVIIWQTLRGIFTSRKIISSELTLPFIGRNKVLTDYIEYCTENNIQKSKAYMIYEKIESEAKLNERIN